MYKNRQRVYNEYLAQAQAIPTNTTTAGNKGPIKAHNTMGGLELNIVAASPGSIGSGKSLTVTMLDCDTYNGAFVALPQVFKITYASAKTFAADDLIGVLPIPSTCRQFIKVNITTDDATPPTGTIDIFPTYLPR